MLGRRAPLAASRRYYPGFFGALFLILLRIAIGWHFLYEGVEKIESTRRGGKPFSAEPYLRNATGPLAQRFRGLVPDVNSLDKLDPAKLKAAWTAREQALSRHYQLDKEQQAHADAELQKALEYADIWFQDKETSEKRTKYVFQLREVQAIERNPKALTFERIRAAEARKDLDKDRKDLIAPLDARADELAKAVANIATSEQREAAGVYKAPLTSLDWINLTTMWGLVLMGVCLILGLFTPLAALGGAVFLGQIYLSMPPWPGLPPSPVAEGHYWIVNKNLIEMIACLLIASTPSGRWVGLDALLSALFGRRREDLEQEPSESPAHLRQRSAAHT